MIVMPLRPNCVSGLMPASARRRMALVDVFPVGTTPWERHVPRLRADRPRPIVSSEKRLASSTKFIRQAEPVVVRTVLISSPKCALRWRRVRCGWRLRRRSTDPRRASRPSVGTSSARCSDASREALVPLARIVPRTNSRTCWRRFDRLFEARPTLPCTKTVTLLQTLRMAVADLQQLGGRSTSVPLVSLGSALRRAQLLGTHPCPSHSRLLLRSLRVGDISIGRSRGLSLGFNTHDVEPITISSIRR